MLQNLVQTALKEMLPWLQVNATVTKILSQKQLN